MPTGKRVRGATYLHRSALSALPDADRKRVDAAALSTGVAWNVVRVSRDDISLLDYADFDDDPFPALRASALVRPGRNAVTRDYSARRNPPVLHRKELLVGDDHPLRSTWSAVTDRLVAAGAFADSHRIGTREAWRRRLEELSMDELGTARG